jgi:3-isopropylmalate/(R)-2-methylmalate dehydratase small subunit
MAIERIRQIRGTPLPLRGDNIDTDRIIPARFLKAITFEGLEAHLFEDDRRQAAARSHVHVFDNLSYERASILIVNANFGCGSSREHAPQALRRRGIRACIGESFSEIFFGNSVALGMPCLTAPVETIERLMVSAEETSALEIVVDLEQLIVQADSASHPLTLPAAARESFLNGTWDATGLLLDRFDEVEDIARRLPYLNDWGSA